MGVALVYVVDAILDLIALAVLIWAILSWLVAFDVINRHNRAVDQLIRGLDAIVGRMLAPLRKIIRPLGGVDITPIVFLILIEAIKIAFDRTLGFSLIALLG